MNRLQKGLALAALGAATLIIAACQPVAQAGTTELSQRVIRVVTTIGMITDIVENVGGERVHVTGLMGPGVDPHLFRASERDVVRLASADLVFYNGLHLEAGMARVLERMADSGRGTVAVTENIDRDVLLAPPEFEGAYDPHVWFDVMLWKHAAETVRDALIQADPAHADAYRANAGDYLAKLEELHAYVTDRAERVPPERRVLITAHDAFNYFGRAYGFQVLGLQGISTESEASIADVQVLADFIAELKIPAIFIESSVPQRNVEAVQAAVRARGFDVRIGGELFSDAMGDAETKEGTYIGMVRHNIDTITDALRGD
jgi:manganese/zinc/iron transport system substrate-binding protein